MSLFAVILLWTVAQAQKPYNCQGDCYLMPEPYTFDVHASPEPEHVIEIRTKHEKPAECKDADTTSNYKSVMYDCLRDIEKQCMKDDTPYFFDIPCRNKLPSCQKWDDLDEEIAEHCQEHKTREVWIDGVKFGTIKETDAP